MRSRWILLVALTGLTLHLCWKVLTPFFSVLMWASVLVLVFHPAHVWLLGRLKKPVPAALLATLLVLATILLPALAVTTAVVGELQTTARGIQNHLTTLLTHPKLPDVVNSIYRLTGSNEVDLRRAVSTSASSMSQSLVQGTISVVGSALGFMVNLGFICFTMFYLFLDGEKFVDIIRDWLPLDGDEGQALLLRCRDIISASVYGVVVVAAVQGLLGGVMFFWLGLSSPLLWTLVMILLSTIPMLGTFVVWVPAAIWLVATGSWIKGLILVLWGTFVIGTADNLMRPHLVGSRTKMHDLLIFFAVLGGLNAFGMLGILMGPVVLAMGMTLLEAFRRADTSAPVLVLTEEPEPSPSSPEPAPMSEEPPPPSPEP